jgi:hypothetical protein
MSLRPRSRLSWALVASAALALSLLPAATASAGSTTKTSNFSVAISPTKVTVGLPTTFTLTVTDAPNSSNSIGSVQVVVPTDMTVDTTATAAGTTSPTGWVYSFPSCSPDSPTGCGTPGTTLVQVNTPSNGGANKVGAGQSLTFTITATSNAKTYPSAPIWATAVKNSAAWSTGQLLTEQGGDPGVTVYGVPAKLVFATAPPSSVVAGVTFGATVAILDSVGDPTISSVAVTLSATALQGVTTVLAVNGIATFSGLSLTKTGTIAVTAGSGSLTTDTASVLVTPAPPANVSAAVDPLSPQAGSAFTASGTVTDRYGNPVPGTSVSLFVDCVPSPTQACTANGSATTDGNGVASLPYTLRLAGTHSVTVMTSGGLSSGPLYFTVVPAPATHLTIDSVADEAGVGVLSVGAPFDVSVTARDDYGNPSPYTGTVSLSATGLGGTTSGSLSGTASLTIKGVTFGSYGNGITLTAAAAGLGSATDTLDVSLYLTTAPASNTAPLSNSGCVVSSSNPVCATLLLPNGAKSTVSLSQGSCSGYTSCLASNAPMLVDARADLGTLYSKNNPATLVLECDKSLCGQGGTNSYPIWFQSSDGTTTVPQIPACPSKGTLGTKQIACQDYVQNHRDNAGNLIAYVLFDQDAKATFP